MFAADLAQASTGWFLEHAYLIGIVPAVGFVLILLFGRHLPAKGAELAILSMMGALVLSIGTAYQWIQRVDSVDEGEASGLARLLGGIGRGLAPRAEEGHSASTFVDPVVRSFTWWQSGPFDVTWGSYIDGLSVIMVVVVSLITTLVLFYSIEYMRGDRRFTYFFAALTLFAAGMLIMVTSESMIQLILGWELMGVTSFMLIGHWWEESYNSRSALKAFFTVRVGDVGLLVGTSILFFGADAYTQERFGVSGFSIGGLQGWALSGEGSHTLITVGAVALFIACIGKSGQFPLHTWLPDAMAGPTPVSSLLHSSTMVVAGVFLVARLYPVFWEGMDITISGVNFITVIAAITIIIAAALAFVQDDIKKVLAYSTISQLGYMMLGLGAGAWMAAVFHIFTHAFFKASLFLSAGSVSHSGSHHSFDMKRDMGGLAKKMPITATCWIVCSLALAGIFPLSGFFSKDEIIDNVGHNGYQVFQIVALVGAVMTGAYMARATYLTFFGKPRGAAAGEHAHEDAHDEADLAHVPAMAGATGGGSHADESLPPAAVGEYEVHAAADAHGADDHGAHGADDHGAHDDHHGAHAGPHESNGWILGPILILTFLAVFAGLINATPFGEGWERLKEWAEPGSAPTEQVAWVSGGTSDELVVDPAATEAATTSASSGEGEEAADTGCGYEAPVVGYCFFPSVSHAEFKWFPNAFISLFLAASGILAGWVLSAQLYTVRSPRLVGLTARHGVLRGGYRFLRNKYYLDDIYEDGVVHATAYPIARAANWFNQRVIDTIVNAVGAGTAAVGRWTNRWIDRAVVDNVVNGVGTVTEESGSALRPTQSGRVSQYAALFFGAAAVGALVLVLINT